MTRDIRVQVDDILAEVAWRTIAGMRDVLIHEYFGVNIHRVWKVVRGDITDLKNKILKIKKNLQANSEAP